jgi:hypothetical protein
LRGTNLGDALKSRIANHFPFRLAAKPSGVRDDLQCGRDYHFTIQAPKATIAGKPDAFSFEQNDFVFRFSR